MMIPFESIGRKIRANISGEGGFTLVEMLVSMVLGIVVLGGIYSSFSTQKKAYALQEQLTEMEQNLRSAVDFMTRDIKMAGCNPNSDMSLIMGSNLGITNAGTNTITLESTNNGIITYDLDNTRNDVEGDSTIILRRNGNPLTENLTSLVFQYYNSDGVEIVAPATVSQRGNIRKVRFTVDVRTTKEDIGHSSGFDKDGDPTTGTSHEERAITDVMGRNLGL